MGNIQSRAFPGGQSGPPGSEGSSWSSSGFRFPFFKKEPEVAPEPEEFVIVPPVISIDRQEVNCMAFSSYDWASSRRPLFLLLNEYLRPGATARFHFQPPAADGVLTSANLRLPDALRKGWGKLLADGPDEQLGDTWADVAVRGHPSPEDPHSFASLIVGTRQGFLAPGLHFAAQSRQSGPGAFGTVPLDVNDPQRSAVDAQLGARYADPTMSAGATFSALQAKFDQAWFLWRHSPQGSPDTHMTFGAQTAPHMRMSTLLDDANSWQQLVAAENTSYFLQYDSGEKDSRFSIFVESAQARCIRLSYYHHLARVRRVYNLFEDDDVVGITNYLDFGASVDMPMATETGKPPAPTRFEAAAAWQVNSNVLVKTAVTSARVCGAFVFKSWWDPAVSLSLMGGWNYHAHEPVAGISLHVDNDTEKRYERGLHTVGTGSLVRQKHAATKAESMVAKKSRMVVRGGDADRAESDAKTLTPPEVTHKQSSLL